MEWRPTNDLLLYGGASRGTKAGGFQGALNVPGIEELEFDEEILTSYEGGLKATLFDGKARLSSAVFYYDYQDYQAFLFDPVAFAANVINLDAKVLGAEFELQARPIDALELSLGLSLLDTEAKDVILPSGSLVDRELPQAPNASLNGIARYTIPVGDGSLHLQGDFNYNSASYFTVVNAPVEREDGYIVGNLRVSYESGDGHWGLAAFVKNVSNTEYRVYSLDLSGDFGISNDRFAPPRWYGGTVSYHF